MPHRPSRRAPPTVRQAAVGADTPAAIVRGVAQGASRTFLARLTEEFLADPLDWARTIGSFVRGLWQG
ncbi:hypothetical protein ACFWEH_36355 [Streptomyces anulatus]|uniref:hypothetical protein n=1 Tax=Streptomyces TaxID=1883 RepID=UPI0011610C11|nr:hypothetical protein [Streptomyces sp. TSRI0395]